ncbi:Oidioi.mRNA.OKI2018_I69.chr1.g2763.t1.cds [Oikopleura dioica]|uniref:Oidioi.mRNA.OKI2018_I69.chr1.g2763.t1.cds n=1 Tax=Oikopleura dioica TaxID=34765 RepID=A0ABN7STU5_OIKDI|nr:Oidioi.mRNA.OKI2018_I69.chr1.g2763.t1.cds [Oikopleura dioica]
MIENLPDCIKDGVDHFSRILGDKEERSKYSLHQVENMRQKRNYLKDFMKLKVYGWCSERYDLPVLYPLICDVFYEMANRDDSQVSIIKRDGGYMVVESMGISFRDFKNHTSPQTLEKLARSCGLDESKFKKGLYPYEWHTDPDQLERRKQFLAYPCFRSTMTIRSDKYPKEMNELIAQRHNNMDPTNILEIGYLLNLHLLIDDEVVIDACENRDKNPLMEFNTAHEYGDNIFEKICQWFTMDEEKGCLQCDPNDEQVQEFFACSPKLYVESSRRWDELEAIFNDDMSMTRFLIDYNFNDVILLEGSISSFAESYKSRLQICLHSFLSIAKLAQTISFIMYDPSVPPIYSIPPKHCDFYNKCREKLSGGITQVLHRAINLNGESEHIPAAARIAPNGKPYVKVIMLDFNSLYPQIFRSWMPCGPGIMFKKDGGRFFADGMFNQRENASIESIQWLEYCNSMTEYNGQIKHAYNHVEKKIAGYSVDGYFEDQDNIVVFEFRGCSFHYCPNLIDAHPDIPPIFDKVRIEREDVQGFITEMLTKEELDQMFPKEENAFCYNAQDYLITSAMLKHYHDKGLNYKAEATLTKGWYCGVSPKCYIMSAIDETELERAILQMDKDVNVDRLYKEVMLSENVTPFMKKSAKGCKKKIPLSFYEYLISIFGSAKKRVTKNVPQIQMDRKRDQMKTWTMERKVINPILTKRIISKDRISTTPLRRANGDFI